jgi:hypothetical protein
MGTLEGFPTSRDGLRRAKPSAPNAIPFPRFFEELGEGRTFVTGFCPPFDARGQLTTRFCSTDAGTSCGTIVAGLAGVREIFNQAAQFLTQNSRGLGTF